MSAFYLLFMRLTVQYLQPRELSLHAVDNDSGTHSPFQSRQLNFIWRQFVMLLDIFLCGKLGNVGSEGQMSARTNRRLDLGLLNSMRCE